MGAAVVLISPAWKRDEVVHALALTTPSHAVGDHPVLAELMPMLHLDEPIAAGDSAFGSPPPDADAVLAFSSGTTGLPKGVAYSHRSSYLHSMAACTMNGLGVGEHDRILPIVPQFHANAWGLPYAAIMSGADLVMPDRFMIPAAIVKLIETEKVTVGAGVPTIWQGVLAHLRTAGGDISSLRTLICGGSALPESVMLAYSDEFGLTMTHAWGMTELSPLGSPQPSKRTNPWIRSLFACQSNCVPKGHSVRPELHACFTAWPVGRAAKFGQLRSVSFVAGSVLSTIIGRFRLNDPLSEERGPN